MLHDVFEDLSEQLEAAAHAWESGDSYEFQRHEAVEMPIDVIDEDDAFLLTVELPGVTRDQLDVSATGRIVTIDATPNGYTPEGDPDERERRTFVMNERTLTTGRRSIQLPESIDHSRIGATLEHGILTITIPKIVATSDRDAVHIEIK